MKSKLRLLAAGLAVLMGTSVAGFAQPVGHDRDFRSNRATYQQYRGDGDHDRDDVRTRRDRDDRFAFPYVWQYRRGDEHRDRDMIRHGGRDDRGFHGDRDDR